MIPKSCRLFGKDHATEQILGAKSRFNLNGFRPGKLVMKASKTPTNPLRGLEDRPGFLIRPARQISQALFVEECAGLNITATQFGVLWVLGHGVELDQIGIARLLGFDRSTTAMVVKLLEDRKLVLRSPDPDDR